MEVQDEKGDGTAGWRGRKGEEKGRGEREARGSAKGWFTVLMTKILKNTVHSETKKTDRPGK